jgi:hypothetical protein
MNEPDTFHFTSNPLPGLSGKSPDSLNLATVDELKGFGASQIESIKVELLQAADGLLGSLTHADQLSSAERRGIIARYSAVLEGNFIYWMTGAYLAARSSEARSIILSNLHEEVRDSHPNMLRRFTLAAHACPNDADALAVYSNVTKVRFFIGGLSASPIIAMMAFFEGFIQKFMPYLAELADRQGSQEREYTDVHGICDVAHSQELFGALAVEMGLDETAGGSKARLFEGVYLLRDLIQKIVSVGASAAA